MPETDATHCPSPSMGPCVSEPEFEIHRPEPRQAAMAGVLFDYQPEQSHEPSRLTRSSTAGRLTHTLKQFDL
jgi:hypothetical protein